MKQGMRALNAIEIRQLQSAHARLRAGDTQTAERDVRAVLAAVPGQSDALHLLGLILKAQGRQDEALAALTKAQQAAPRHPHILNSLANLLADMGDPVAAIRAYQASLKIDPANAPCWTNLGLAALDAADMALARQALSRAVQLDPGSGAAWCAIGLVEKADGALDRAAAAFERALSLDPADDRSRFNLAIVLRLRGEMAQALVLLDATRSQQGPVAQCARAEMLADMGDFSGAVALLETVARQAPLHLDAHESLARLLPQLDPSRPPLASFAQTLAAEPGSRPLWRSAISSAMELKLFRPALDWIEQAERQLGPSPELARRRAGCLMMLDDLAAAQAQLDAILASNADDEHAHNLLAWMKLKQRDFAAAAHHAQCAVQRVPIDQSSWAYLATAWEMMDHPQARWLANYAQLVQEIELPAPPGFASIEAFMGALAERLNALHRLNHHPAEQSLRHGTQTRGNLLDWREPLLRAAADSIRAGVAAALRSLKPDAGHPFLSRLPKDGAIRFSGSWSVRLRSEGYHISHYHSQGWMSSALYVSLPPEVAQPDGSDAGLLAFGVPDARLGLEREPARTVQPRVGLLATFPSYFWHGTIPFSSDQPRLTMAFDALPA